MEAIDVNVFVNRNEPMWSLAILRKFSLPARFDGLNVREHLLGMMDIWVNAPWLQRDAIVLGSVCQLQVDRKDWLLCGAMLSALEKFA